MRFEWDEAKRLINLRKHGIDFLDAKDMFTGQQPFQVALDSRKEYGEERFIGIGYIRQRVMVVVFTEPAPDTIRIISVRKALKHEQKKYEEALRQRLV